MKLQQKNTIDLLSPLVFSREIVICIFLKMQHGINIWLKENPNSNYKNIATIYKNTNLPQFTDARLLKYLF